MKVTFKGEFIFCYCIAIVRLAKQLNSAELWERVIVSDFGNIYTRYVSFGY